MYSGKALELEKDSQGLGNEKRALHRFTDFDYARDIELRKSTFGYVFMFARGVILIQSKRQLITVLSTIEAEYYGMYKAVIEATWLQYIFIKLG